MYSSYPIQTGERQRRGSAGAPYGRSVALTRPRATVSRRRRVRRGAAARPHPREDTSCFAVQHAAAARNARIHETPIPQLPSYVARHSRPRPVSTFPVVAAVLVIVAIVLAVIA
ncbi:hypothetical protein [Olsenella sp. Marseille-P4559]|uniref:hypothetical protein n=1 Tax=Olsenella sp. Marseille-P4559 TaxID=2364795 RepID=UPI001A910E38|nr:hypothetical protein [Olsenella sp. Marseille-P4559]